MPKGASLDSTGPLPPPVPSAMRRFLTSVRPLRSPRPAVALSAVALSARALSAALLTTLVAVTASPALAQSIPEKELGKANAVLDDLDLLRGLHELADGRVVLLDGRAARVQVGDFATKKLATTMAAGYEDNELRAAQGPWAWRGDSIALLDPIKGRLVVLSPAGTFVRFEQVAEARPGAVQGAAPAAAPGAGPVVGALPNIRFIAGGVAIGNGSVPRQQVNPTLAPPRVPYPLLRYHLATRAVDTLLRIMPPQEPRPPYVNRNLMTFTTYVGTMPVQAVDAWAAFSDGTVAIVRGATYKIDLIAPDGTRTQVGPVPHTLVPLDGHDKKGVMDDAKRATENFVRVNAGRMQGSTLGFEEPTAWPANNPPFRGDLLPRVDRQDRIWLHTRCGANVLKVRCYDVIDRSGARVARVRIPNRTSVVGFGASSVYTVDEQKADKPVLQRHPMPF